jgi:hypothetical protein
MEKSVQTYSPITDELAAQWAEDVEYWDTRAKLPLVQELNFQRRQLLAERQYLLGLLRPFADAEVNIKSCGRIGADYEVVADGGRDGSFDLCVMLGNFLDAASAMRERSGQGIVASGPEISEPLA